MVTMNPGGLRDAERGAAEREGLAGMRARFVEIASNRAIFGDVPNAEQAAAALRTAVLTMLRELEQAGRDVEDIRRSAATAAVIADDSDAEAKRALRRADSMTYLADMMARRPGAAPGTGGG